MLQFSWKKNRSHYTDRSPWSWTSTFLRGCCNVIPKKSPRWRRPGRFPFSFNNFVQPTSSSLSDQMDFKRFDGFRNILSECCCCRHPFGFSIWYHFTKTDDTASGCFMFSNDLPLQNFYLVKLRRWKIATTRKTRNFHHLGISWRPKIIFRTTRSGVPDLRRDILNWYANIFNILSKSHDLNDWLWFFVL